MGEVTRATWIELANREQENSRQMARKAQRHLSDEDQQIGVTALLAALVHEQRATNALLAALVLDSMKGDA